MRCVGPCVKMHLQASPFKFMMPAFVTFEFIVYVIVYTYHYDLFPALPAILSALLGCYTPTRKEGYPRNKTHST